MNTEITIKLGETGADFVKKNPNLVKVDKQPAGLNFYQIVWAAKSPGRVFLDNGPSSLHLANVLTVLSSEDADAIGKADSSFQTVTIGAGLSDQEFISHDSARLAFYALLQDATAAGWRPVVSASDPRILGKERLDYALNRDRTIGLDGKYIPTLDEWMQIEDMTSWLLYANHVFLELSFQREQGRMDPSKSGAYFVSFGFQTDVEHFRSYVGVDNRLAWRDELLGALADAHKNRSKVESELKASGIHIDESYQDPPPPAR